MRAVVMIIRRVRGKKPLQMARVQSDDVVEQIAAAAPHPTKHEVYFGIACFDSQPPKIVATELRRDVSQKLDDYFEIVIDSAHDRRNAYVFQINPLGTQRDALITEEQRTDSSTGDGDSGWDGVWTSEARITKEGWTATIGIPFSTLNFMKSRDVVWGINFKRFIRRKMKRIYGPAGVVFTAPQGSARQESCTVLPRLGVGACLSSSRTD
jgi:hypothetical protein